MTGLFPLRCQGNADFPQEWHNRQIIIQVLTENCTGITDFTAINSYSSRFITWEMSSCLKQGWVSLSAGQKAVVETEILLLQAPYV